jgi:poly(A) polymerase
MSGPDPSHEAVRLIQAFLASRGTKAYLVGGFLRDSLLGIPTQDIDIAVDGDASLIARELADRLDGSFVPLGEQHQMARVVFSLEGEGWQADVSSVQGTIEEDLARRDFTVDAMALPLPRWSPTEWRELLLDPFNGQDDLSRRTVRAVSDSTFKDDPARLLRGPRLAAALGFAIEDSTREIIGRDAALLADVSAERIRDEFLAIMSLADAKKHLEMLDELGLLTRVVPELEVARDVAQPKEHYWDVLQHSLETVAEAERVLGSVRTGLMETVPWDGAVASRFAEVVSDGHDRRTLLKLAALLHDVAKPITKAVDENGRTRFLGHPARGSLMAGDILERLRLSRRGVKMVCRMVEYHLRPTQMSQGVEMPTARAVYRYFRDLEDVAIDTLYLCLADYLAARGPLLVLDDWLRHVRIVRHILQTGLEERAPERRAWLINGHDLVEDLGLSPGPFLGEVLEAVHEAQAAGDVGTREEAQAWACNYIKRSGRRICEEEPLEPSS